MVKKIKDEKSVNEYSDTMKELSKVAKDELKLAKDRVEKLKKEIFYLEKKEKRSIEDEVRLKRLRGLEKKSRKTIEEAQEKETKKYFSWLERFVFKQDTKIKEKEIKLYGKYLEKSKLFSQTSYGKSLLWMGEKWSKFQNTKYFRVIANTYERIKQHAMNIWQEILGPAGEIFDMLMTGAKFFWNTAKQFGGIFKFLNKNAINGFFVKIRDAFTGENRKNRLDSVEGIFMSQSKRQERWSEKQREAIIGVKESVDNVAGILKGDSSKSLKERLREKKDKSKGFLEDKLPFLFGAGFDIKSLLKGMGGLAAGASIFSAGMGAFKGWDEKEAERLFGDKGFLSKLGSSVSHALSGFTFGMVKPESIAEGLKGMGDMIKDGASYLWENVKEIGRTIRKPFDLMMEIFDNAAKWVTDKLETIMKYIPDFIKKSWDIAREFPGKAYEAAKTGASYVYETGKELGTKALSGFQNVKDYIMGAAEKTGVSANTLTKIAGVESSFDPNAGAKTSSAKGLYQFTGGTWSDMVKKYGSQYGVGLGDVYDPEKNALMGAQFLKDNQKAIRRLTGKEATDTDLYLGHFLGTGGVSKFMKAEMAGQGGMSAAELMGQKVARSNEGIFYDKSSGRERSLDEVRQLLHGRLERFDLSKLERSEASATQKGQGADAIRRGEAEKAKLEVDQQNKLLDAAQQTKGQVAVANAEAKTEGAGGGPQTQVPDASTYIFGGPVLATPIVSPWG